MAESRVPVGHHDLEREVIIDALLAVPPISSKGHWQSLLPCAHNNCERTNCTWANLLREAPGDVPSHIRGEADRTLFELTELTGDHWMRVIALPFSRQRWLYAVSSTGQVTAPAVPPKQTASGIVGWAHSVVSSASQKAQSMLQRQWDGLVQAPDGSIKNRFYRMAMAVLAREDVTESFLKTIPTDVAQLQLIAPADLPVSVASTERYVRRRMRLMLRQQERLHQCRMVSWLGAIVPSAPLAFLPIPNIPMYYAGYRAWSHWKALKGARQALGLFQQAELLHVDRMREQLRGQNSAAGASSSPTGAVTVCTLPDLDAPAREMSSVHEEDKPADLTDVAAQYDLPDLQDFYRRAMTQRRPKAP